MTSNSLTYENGEIVQHADIEANDDDLSSRHKRSHGGVRMVPTKLEKKEEPDMSSVVME